MAEKNKSMGIRKTIGWMGPFIRPYKHWLFLSIVSSVILIAFNIIKVYYINQLVGNGLNGRLSGVVGAAVVLLIAIFAGIGASYLVKYSTGRFAVSSARDLRDTLCRYAGDLPVWKAERTHSGDMVSRLNNDAATIERFLGNDFSNLVFQPLMLLCAVVFMFTINWKLLLVSFIFTPVAMYTSNRISKKIGKSMNEYLNHLGQATGKVQDALNGMGTIKAFNLEEPLWRKCAGVFKESMYAGVKIEKYTCLFVPFLIMMLEFPGVLCVIYGGYLAARGEIQVGGLIAFFQLLDYIIQPSTVLPGLLEGLRRTAGTIARLSEVLDEPVERKDGGTFTLGGDTPVIQFDDLSFGYEKTERVLQNMGFQLRQGEMVALVGASGSGKSTIMNLLCGFYEWDEGDIKLYGKSIKEWSLVALRRQMAFVSQDVYLFPGTVRENILYGRPDATMDEVIAACKTAHAHEFIKELPRGYDTQVGERGVLLSGGQRQRIAIARAVLKNAPVLLLDEPTSALDTHSEALVQDALEHFIAGRTVLVIAHRFSTIKQADNILVLEHGRIAESGTHGQLMDMNGLYKQLYFKQLVSRDSNQAEGA